MLLRTTLVSPLCLVEAAGVEPASGHPNTSRTVETTRPRVCHHPILPRALGRVNKVGRDSSGYCEAAGSAGSTVSTSNVWMAS